MFPGKMRKGLRALLLGAVIAGCLSARSTFASPVLSPEIDVTHNSTLDNQQLSWSSPGIVNSQSTLPPDHSVPDYTWSYWGNSDPIINWGFSASSPGTYDVTFILPVVGGPYDTLKNQASVTVSDGGPGFDNPTSVTNVLIDGQVPSGTVIPGVSLTGDVTAPDGSFPAVGHTYGPVTVIQSFGSPASMAVHLHFDLTSLDNDGSAAFVGQLSLQPTVGSPEPATGALLCIAVAGFVGMGRSLRGRPTA
jgi:hypothetical protein